jgi:DNA ligase-1
MQRFTDLYTALGSTTRTAEKVAALDRYFAAAEPADAAWALFFLTGNRLKRLASTALLRDWIAETAGLPLWLVEECYDAVGDLAEALALLVPPHQQTAEEPLHEVVERRMLALKSLTPDVQKQIVQQAWREFSPAQCLVWHKLITGEFRVGVARTLVVRALASVAHVPPATMAHRLMGDWQPTAASYVALLSGSQSEDPGRPYPFFLAHPLEEPLEWLGDIGDWQAEWKWDGIRAQAIRRAGQLMIWSRGEELVTDRFPELGCLVEALPEGTVLDGEILAWQGELPMPFAALQTRIGRKRLTPKVLAASPVAFMAYDLLEDGGVDVRPLPLGDRRGRLEQLIAGTKCQELRLSPIVAAPTWSALEEGWRGSRERLVEGLMLKRRDSAYGVGRPRGAWWKWKISPHTVDAVLIYAQRGHGRRASLYTDYTFGVWDNGELVPVAKAYSGLTDEEIRDVDSFVRGSTLEKFGPVRVVKPELVFELHFEGIQASSRHKSGIAVRFPRMARWRRDKKPDEADTLDSLRRLLASLSKPSAGSKPAPGEPPSELQSPVTGTKFGTG